MSTQVVMNAYQGLPISETRLWIEALILTLMLLVSIAVTGVFLYLSLTGKGKNEKEKQRLQKLKEKAPNDALAQKQLEKLERKRQRKKRRGKAEAAYDLFITGIGIALSLTILILGVLPGWNDYLRKDYVIYTGEISVTYKLRNRYIELEDGTVVRSYDLSEFDSDDTFGTVIYAKRTGLYLGGSSS